MQWDNDLPEALIERLANCSLTVGYKRGDIIHWQEEGDVNALFYILKGAINISSNSREGMETVLTYLPSGNWFGEIAMFDGLHRTHTAIAHEDSQLLKISKSDVENITQDYPIFYEYIIKLLCEKIRMLMIVVEETSTLPLPVRLAGKLIGLAESFGARTENGLEILIRLPQEELGQMLGTSRQSTNKLLKQFERSGLIETKYRHIILKDLDAFHHMIKNK